MFFPLTKIIRRKQIGDVGNLGLLVRTFEGKDEKEIKISEKNFSCDKNCKLSILKNLAIPATPIICKHGIEHVIVVFRKH